MMEQNNFEEIQDRTELGALKDTRQYLENVNQQKSGSMLPPPPKPGEIMYCQVCGKPMLPDGFSKKDWMRKREFKWHIHEACFITMDNLVDRKTPGLIADRNRK